MKTRDEAYVGMKVRVADEWVGTVVPTYAGIPANEIDVMQDVTGSVRTVPVSLVTGGHRATCEQLLAALAGVVRPCPPDRGNWYGCRGDDDPTVGRSCADDQCTDPTHETRRPCLNVWHTLDPEVRAAVLAHGATG